MSIGTKHVATDALVRPAEQSSARQPQSHLRANECPRGATENSPALQRWELAPLDSSPGGTTEISYRLVSTASRLTSPAAICVNHSSPSSPPKRDIQENPCAKLSPPTTPPKPLAPTRKPSELKA